MVVVDAVISWVVSNILDKVFGKKMGKEILEINNRRLVELLNDKDREIDKLRLDKQEIESENITIFEQIRMSGISTEKLLDELLKEYNKPLYAILLCTYFQKVSDGTLYGKKEQFVFNELQRYDCKSLGGGIYLVPPKSVPDHVNNRKSLHEWFDTEILKGKYCKLKFLLLVDLRDKVYWMNNLPYKPTENAMHKIHVNIGDVLPIEELFKQERISQTTTIAKIINSGDIGWLARKYVSESELSIIRLNQVPMENALGKPTLNEFALDSFRNKLAIVLQQFGIGKSDEVAMLIISEARFWQKELK